MRKTYKCHYIDIHSKKGFYYITCRVDLDKDLDLYIFIRGNLNHIYTWVQTEKGIYTVWRSKKHNIHRRDKYRFMKMPERLYEYIVMRAHEEVRYLNEPKRRIMGG